MYGELQKLPAPMRYEPEFAPQRPDTGSREFTVEKPEDGVFVIDAPWLERILDGSNVDDWESLQYFQRQLESTGVLENLQALGVQENDTIKIGDYEFDYVF